MPQESVQRQVGTNPFLQESALVDVLHRLGFNPDSVCELESFWWFMSPCDITPDDLASRLMQILPLETHQEAEKRRSLGRMNLVPPDIGKLRRR